MEVDASADALRAFLTHSHDGRVGPEFTVRNYNALRKHAKPFPHNAYSVVHGKHIFAKIENYKVFLDEVRLMVQPDGVVDFAEIDPRPRTTKPGPSQANHPSDHVSGPATGFTDNIADRYKSPLDVELATDVPNWVARVDARIKGSFRPHDGIAAANLKSWVEGAGYVLP
jgi:hypothetical protein